MFYPNTLKTMKKKVNFQLFNFHFESNLFLGLFGILSFIGVSKIWYILYNTPNLPDGDLYST